MQDLKTEKEWHKQKFYIDSGHWTSKPLFASRERHWLKNEQQKIRFYGYLCELLKQQGYGKKLSVLFAPIGSGDDCKYIKTLSNNIYGIDISEIELAACPRYVVTVQADILNSGYRDSSFDVVICSLFLHHVHEIGFTLFLNEFSRILRGGILAILEPSSFYPLRILINILESVMGNVSGKVPYERPIAPTRLLKDLKESGFKDIKVVGQTFNHVRFPVALQLLISLIDYPLRHLKPFSYFSETIGFFAKKP